MTVAYPLKWPDGWERTPSHRRSNYSRFKTTFEQARQRLSDELRLLGAKNIVISTNLELRRDGQPRAEMARRKMADPGVAVYFTYRGGKQMAMARDAFENVHDNMADALGGACSIWTSTRRRRSRPCARPPSSTANGTTATRPSVRMPTSAAPMSRWSN